MQVCVRGTMAASSNTIANDSQTDSDRQREPQYLLKTILITALKGAIRRYPTRIIMLEVIQMGRAKNGY